MEFSSLEYTYENQIQSDASDMFILSAENPNIYSYFRNLLHYLFCSVNFENS